MWHNKGPFPENESDANAFKKCISPDAAAKYCPVRWEAVNRYIRLLPFGLFKMSRDCCPELNAPQFPVDGARF